MYKKSKFVYKINICNLIKKIIEIFYSNFFIFCFFFVVKFKILLLADKFNYFIINFTKFDLYIFYIFN